MQYKRLCVPVYMCKSVFLVGIFRWQAICKRGVLYLIRQNATLKCLRCVRPFNIQFGLPYIYTYIIGSAMLCNVDITRPWIGYHRKSSLRFIGQEFDFVIQWDSKLFTVYAWAHSNKHQYIIHVRGYFSIGLLKWDNSIKNWTIE